MGTKIYVVKDSSIVPQGIGRLIVNGKDPVSENYCAIRANTKGDEEYDANTDEEEEYIIDIGEDGEGTPETSIADGLIRIGYYAGLIRAAFDPNEKNEEETVLRGISRFPRLSVSGMLEAILGDDEINSYLKTGVNGGDLTADSLYMLGKGPISLEVLRSAELIPDNEIETTLEKEIEEIKKEYELICKCECIRSRCMSKEEHDTDGFQTACKANDNTIRSYAINLALLFELYSRWYVKNHMGVFAGENAEMLDYVPDKKPDKTKTLGEHAGAKYICDTSECKLENKFYLQALVVPDIVIQAGDQQAREYYIYDAKYKNPTGKHDRNDRLQILAYAFLYQTEKIGHIFPSNGTESNGTDWCSRKEFEVESDHEHPVTYRMIYIACPKDKQSP